MKFSLILLPASAALAAFAAPVSTDGPALTHAPDAPFVGSPHHLATRGLTDQPSTQRLHLTNQKRDPRVPDDEQDIQQPRLPAPFIEQQQEQQQEQEQPIPVYWRSVMETARGIWEQADAPKYQLEDQSLSFKVVIEAVARRSGVPLRLEPAAPDSNPFAPLVDAVQFVMQRTYLALIEPARQMQIQGFVDPVAVICRDYMRQKGQWSEIPGWMAEAFLQQPNNPYLPPRGTRRPLNLG
ncbi:hypothetical protein FRB99_001839 [Tulasnella sp. 403]|nr:hypothetical protein FRB99_001839 [Tulasnella sp. 403]